MCFRGHQGFHPLPGSGFLEGVVVEFAHDASYSKAHAKADPFPNAHSHAYADRYALAVTFALAGWYTVYWANEKGDAVTSNGGTAYVLRNSLKVGNVVARDLPLPSGKCFVVVVSRANDGKESFPSNLVEAP